MAIKEYGAKPPARSITINQFLDRVPVETKIGMQIAIINGGKSTATAEETQAAATLRVIQGQLENAQNGWIELDHPRTLAGLQALQAMGFLTAEQIEVILA